MSAPARELDAQSSALSQDRTMATSTYTNIRRLRLLKRRKVNLPAFLKQGERAFAIEIRNISAGGAGLTLPASVTVGESVSLHLLDGRQLTGKLQWSRMGFAGVEFDSPLESGDPLLGVEDNAEAATGPVAGVPQTVAKILSFAASVSASLHDRGKRTKDHAMLEAACRKQGFAWLSDEEDLGPRLPE